MSQPVLHVDFISLRNESQQDRQQLLEAATGLADMEQVASLGVIEAGDESAFDLAFYFLLHDFTSLEPFGTDARYSRFLQGAVAPRLKAFAGADVRLEGALMPAGDHAACLALMAPEQTYDWEVREALQAWAAATGSAAAVVGLAVGERQQYRGLALAFGDVLKSVAASSPERFVATLISGKMQALA